MSTGFGTSPSQPVEIDPRGPEAPEMVLTELRREAEAAEVRATLAQAAARGGVLEIATDPA